MGGTVPLEEMSEDRAALLVSVAHIDPGSTSKKKLMDIIDRLADAASTCPRIGCATCSFMSKHEAGTVAKEGSST